MSSLDVIEPIGVTDPVVLNELAGRV